VAEVSNSSKESLSFSTSSTRPKKSSSENTPSPILKISLRFTEPALVTWELVLEAIVSPELVLCIDKVFQGNSISSPAKI